MASDRPKGVISLSGRDYPTWPFVLNKAHETGLLSVETTLLQIPAEENGRVAIVQAVATFAPITEGGELRRFSGLGDADPKNTSAKVALHLIRMAETRAMGRALRAGTNIGETMYEEFGEIEEPGKERAREAVRQAETQSRYGAEADQAVTDAAARGRERMAEGPQTGAAGCEVCGVVMTSGQLSVSKRNFQKALCPAHQKDALAARDKGQVAA